MYNREEYPLLYGLTIKPQQWDKEIEHEGYLDQYSTTGNTGGEERRRRAVQWQAVTDICSCDEREIEKFYLWTQLCWGSSANNWDK